jgi:PAS domain S-box-containing protein
MGYDIIMVHSTDVHYRIGDIVSENIDDLIYILNSDFKCEYVNIEKHLDKLGYSSVGRKITEFIYFKDLDIALKFLKNVVNLGETYEQFRMKEKRGYKYYELKGKKFIDNDEDVKMLVISRDISKFKDAEMEWLSRIGRFKEMTEDLPEIRYWNLLQPKSTKTAIQTTRQMLDLVIDNIPQYIYWKDTKLNYLGCNTNYLMVNGLSSVDFIIGKSDEDLYWPRHIQDKIKESETRVIRNGKSERRIELLALPDTSAAWFETNRIPLLNLDGDVMGVLSTYNDITERVIAERKLSESEEKYRSILENMKEGYFEVDLKGDFLFVNNAFCQIIGYDYEEIIGKNYAKFANVQNQDNVFKAFNEVYKTNVGKKHGQFEFFKRAGEKLIIEMSINLKANSEGNQIFFGVVQDITEKEETTLKLKESQEQLQALNKELEYKVELRTKELAESEEKYRHLYEHSPAGIVLLDEDGSIIDINSTVPKIFGYDKVDLIGKKYSKLLNVYPDKTINEVREPSYFLIDINKKDASFKPKIVQIFKKDGSSAWIESEISLIKLKGLNRILVIVQDITEKKLAEEKLRESEKLLREQNIELKELDRLKTDFISIAAHELKTPLISIGGYADLILLREKNLKEVIREDLDRIVENVHRLETYINKLLDVMKIDAEKMELSLEEINLYQVITDTIDELDFQINQKNLKFSINLDKNVMITADGFRISQVFSNLLSNAIKFSPDGGNIDIRVDKEEDNYLFKIKDQGKGLGENEIKKLFAKFVTLGKGVEKFSTFEQGSGLGLYIAKGIIQAHGGKIWVNSEGIGKGAEFLFTIPINSVKPILFKS